MVRQFHPVADLFPLLTGEPLQELAADIKKNELREPILLDPEGRIIDGRNRYRACNLAGVEPRFVQWEGQGTLPEVALSLNLHRRHLDESQRAMVAAPDGQVDGKGGHRATRHAHRLPGKFAWKFVRTDSGQGRGPAQRFPPVGDQRREGLAPRL